MNMNKSRVNLGATIIDGSRPFLFVCGGFVLGVKREVGGVTGRVMEITFRGCRATPEDAMVETG